MKKNRYSQNGEADGYVKDYITGKKLKATPEEIEARQVFEKRLVDEYGYSKDQIDINFMIQKGSMHAPQNASVIYLMVPLIRSVRGNLC